MPVASPRERFRESIQGSDGKIDLAEAALWIAAEDSQPIDVADYMLRLDSIAAEVEPGVRLACSDRARVEVLNRSLFVDQHFSGNRDDYYDPRNSWLNDVLDRKLGIPISLAIVYIAVAQRLGLDVCGISFPGHFLLKHVGAAETVVDPFVGRILDREDCRELLAAVGASDAEFRPALQLRAATNREILVRLLSNLKYIWLRRSDFERALACCDRILLLAPDAPEFLRDRGLVHEHLECHGAAIADFERCLRLAPSDDLAPAVRARVAALRTGDRRLH